MENVTTTSRGYTISVEDNEVGGRRYWSDSVDGGVVIWDTALVSEEELLLAINIERDRKEVENLKIPFTKYQVDDKVAVLYSPGFGAGWYTWNGHEGMLFDIAIVKAVLYGDREKAAKIAEQKYGAYTGGAEDLVVGWVTKGERFEILEYDGSESLRIFGPEDGIQA